MREIIHIQVGQCGNQISEKFWTNIAHEHAIDLSGKPDQNPQWERELHREVFFKENLSGRYSARLVATDLDPAGVANITAGPAGKLFLPDSIVVNPYFGGSGNNFAKGHYTEGAELIDQIMDVIRREAETSDCLQGFQIAHSIGGGTGSGLATLLLSKTREEYPDRMMFTFTVAPSRKVSEAVVEPYNATLALHHLIENADGVIVLDNDALYDICFKQLKLIRPNFSNLNEIVGLAMSNATSSCRFPGQLNSDLRKMAVNMFPYYRMHFLTPGLSPMYPPQIHRSPDVPELLLDAFQTPNQLVSCEPFAGRFLAGALTLRGQICPSEVEKNLLRNFQDRYSKNFVEWIPDSLKSSCCPVAPPGYSLTASLLSHNTSIKQMFERIHSHFSKLFRRKAFLYGLRCEGMSEMEFSEAGSNLSDLIDEYNMYQDISADEEDEQT